MQNFLNPNRWHIKLPLCFYPHTPRYFAWQLTTRISQNYKYGPPISELWLQLLRKQTNTGTSTTLIAETNTSTCTRLRAVSRLANDVWIWSWGLRGINPAISSLWLAVESLKFKNKWIERNVVQKRWHRQPSVHVHRRPCSLPPVNGHYGLPHRSTENLRREVRLKWRCMNGGIAAL
jgi:hypothetical protein